LKCSKSSGAAELVVFAAEFEELAASAPPSLPTTEDAAGVAIVVFVEFEEVEAVADSVADPGTGAVASMTGPVEFDYPVASGTGEDEFTSPT